MLLSNSATSQPVSIAASASNFSTVGQLDAGMSFSRGTLSTGSAPMPAEQAFPPMSRSLVVPQPTPASMQSGFQNGLQTGAMPVSNPMTTNISVTGLPSLPQMTVDGRSLSNKEVPPPSSFQTIPPPSIPSVANNIVSQGSNIGVQVGATPASNPLVTNISLTGFPSFPQAAVDGRPLSNNEVMTPVNLQASSTGKPVPMYPSQPTSAPVPQFVSSQRPAGSNAPPPSHVFQSQPSSGDPFLPARGAAQPQYLQSTRNIRKVNVQNPEDNGVLDVFIDKNFSPVQSSIASVVPEHLRIPDMSMLVDQERLNDLVRGFDAEAISAMRRPGGRRQPMAGSAELQPGFWMKVQGDDCMSRRVEPHWFDGKWWLVAPTDLKGVKKPHTLGGRNYQVDGVDAALQGMEDKGEMPYLPKHYHAGKDCPIS